MECPAIVLDEDGIHFVLTSLSPVALSWGQDDDAFEIQSVIGKTVRLHLRSGQGGHCIVALYNSAGQFITSVTRSVSAQDGDLALSGLPIPDGQYMLKAFYLAADYTPVLQTSDFRKDGKA